MRRIRKSVWMILKKNIKMINHKTLKINNINQIRNKMKIYRRLKLEVICCCVMLSNGM